MKKVFPMIIKTNFSSFYLHTTHVDHWNSEFCWSCVHPKFSINFILGPFRVIDNLWQTFHWITWNYWLVMYPAANYMIHEIFTFFYPSRVAKSKKSSKKPVGSSSYIFIISHQQLTGTVTVSMIKTRIKSFHQNRWDRCEHTVTPVFQVPSKPTHSNLSSQFPFMLVKSHLFEQFT